MQMPDTVPPLPPEPSQTDKTRKGEALEFELLEAEAALRRLARREVGQRLWLRWIAVACGVLVIAGMATMLGHLVHRVFWGPFAFAGSAFSVAMIVAPITSITAITVALFVGAFRRFDDKDLESLGNGFKDGVGLFRSGS